MINNNNNIKTIFSKTESLYVTYAPALSHINIFIALFWSFECSCCQLSSVVGFSSSTSRPLELDEVNSKIGTGTVLLCWYYYYY